MGDGTWFACEEPERVPDAWVRWHHEGCTPCRVKAEAQHSRFPDDPHVAWLVGSMGVPEC